MTQRSGPQSTAASGTRPFYARARPAGGVSNLPNRTLTFVCTNAKVRRVAAMSVLMKPRSVTLPKGHINPRVHGCLHFRIATQFLSMRRNNYTARRHTAKHV